MATSDSIVQRIEIIISFALNQNGPPLLVRRKSDNGILIIKSGLKRVSSQQ